MITPTVDADGNVVEDISFLPKVNILDFEIAQKTLKEVNEMLAGNINTFLKGNVPVLLVGACLGAAISAGVAMGIFGMLQYLSTSYDISVHNKSSINKSKQKPLLRRIHSSIKNVLRPFFFKNESHYYSSQQNYEAAKDTSHAKQSKIKVMKVQPSQVLSNSNEKQVRECFDAITLNLGKQLLTWNHVYRITLYHISQNGGLERDSAFQKILKEYPVRKDLVTTIVQVSKLENENINVEIEAIVCTE
jgi:enamine deaminase RidA (YjgF/YER057c/UK114 family)